MNRLKNRTTPVINLSGLGTCCILALLLMVSGCGGSQPSSVKEGEPPQQVAQTQPTVEIKPSLAQEAPKPPDPGQDKPSKTYTKDEPHPIITFEKLAHDFGEAQQNQDLTHQFKFKNTGERDLEVVNVRGG